MSWLAANAQPLFAVIAVIVIAANGLRVLFGPTEGMWSARDYADLINNNPGLIRELPELRKTCTKEWCDEVESHITVDVNTETMRRYGNVI